MTELQNLLYHANSKKNKNKMCCLFVLETERHLNRWRLSGTWNKCSVNHECHKLASEEKLHEDWICRREKRQWSMSKASPRKVKDLEEVETKKDDERTSCG